MAGKAGASGRPPKPIEQKRRTGIHPERLPDVRRTSAIEPATGAPVPIALEMAGQEIWRELVEAPWVAKLDLRLVMSYCEISDQIVSMMQTLDTDGMVLEEPMITPVGHIVPDAVRKVPHPLLRELRAAQKHQLEIAIQLGLTPVARSRMGVAEIKARSKLAELKERYAADDAG